VNLEEINRMAESANKMLADYRATIAKAAADPHTADYLNDLVIKLAEAEGSTTAIIRVQRALQYQANHPENGDVDWQQDLVDLILNGADDSWSGRGNDVKRAQFDGLRKQARRLLDR